MKDKQMLSFIKSNPAPTYADWQAYCQERDEPAGSYSEFLGRLERTLEAQQRRRSGRHGGTVGVRTGGHP